jgi:protein TonB
MYADRHAARRPKPFSLGAAIVINGALVGALLFSNMEVPLIPKAGPLIGFDVPDPPAPKPEEPKPLEHKTTKAPISDPIPDNPTHIVDTTVTESTYFPPNDGGEVAPPGDGGGVIVDPPAPPPVYVEPGTDSRYARFFQPPYPASEIRAGREGTATVRVLIGTDGRVKAVEKVRATSDAFYEATRSQALGKWRFRAATRGGVPEEAWKVMTVRFVLEN